MSDPRPHRRVEVDVPDRVEELDAVAHRALERLGAAHLSDHDAIRSRRECDASRPEPEHEHRLATRTVQST
jgi:hypothetical protein